MSYAQIIGDEIRWDAYLVGLLATAGVPATVMADFREFIEHAELGGDEEACGPPPSGNTETEAFAYADALSDVMREVTRVAKNGLLQLSAVAAIIDQLRTENE